MQVRKFDFESIWDRLSYATMLRKRSIAIPDSFEFFPPTGAIVEVDGVDVCAGFLIKCDNNTCIFTDLVSDPDVEKELRNDAVDVLREWLSARGAESKLRVVMSLSSQPKIVERLKEQGFKILNENVTHMGRTVWP